MNVAMPKRFPPNLIRIVEESIYVATSTKANGFAVCSVCSLGTTVVDKRLIVQPCNRAHAQTIRACLDLELVGHGWADRPYPHVMIDSDVLVLRKMLEWDFGAIAFEDHPKLATLLEMDPKKYDLFCDLQKRLVDIRAKTFATAAVAANFYDVYASTMHLSDGDLDLAIQVIMAESARLAGK